MKVDFVDRDNFTIYYLFNDKVKTEDEMKVFLKLLNHELKSQYNYEFHGFYNVTIFCCEGLYVLKFECIDDYSSVDFDITMLLNSVLLYEFDDSDIIDGNKVYYDSKFYVEAVDMKDDIHFFEYGTVIYGDKVNEILNNGILVTI